MIFNKLYILVWMLFLIPLQKDSNAQVAVVVNKSVPESSINSEKLTDIYLLRAKAWPNGQAVVPFTFKSDNTASEKLFSTIGKSSSDMKKLWMKLQLTGEGMAPEALGSDEEVINKVSSIPGAIGFVDPKKVNDKVKVLLIIN